jgi:hypothetical protein
MKYLITLLVFVFSISAFAVDFKVNGVYTAWAQSQHQFTLTKDAYDDDYVVQMLRFKVQAVVNENLKIVTRFDMAQGWWGVDNALRGVKRTGATGGSALFDYKDTNFLFHVDQAYADFSIPNTCLSGRVGRMWFGLGNKIMVDNNYDGIQLDIVGKLANKVTIGWAKVNENGDGLSDAKTTDDDGNVISDTRDADLFTLNINGAAMDGKLKYDVFGFYYFDRSVDDGTAYIPGGLNFFKTRFSPQITSLMAFGTAATYKMGKFTFNGEFDYLTGKDDIDNEVFGLKQLWDKNDGDLSGYNLYLKAQFAATEKVDVGGVLGMGSGDDDLTGGAGNVNKLRTSGFFYITEIWEDSIMPDEEGITPQGLGAPNVRGYRELENSTIAQVNTNIKLFKGFSAFFSYSYIMATQAVHAWTDDGNGDWKILDDNSTDLGQEIDFKFVYALMPNTKLLFRGGYFMPGDAAGYLINGHNKDMQPAYELKGMFLVKF